MPQEGVAQFVRSNFDEATTYGAYYMGLAMDYARGRLQMQDLYAADATKVNIIAGLNELDPLFCFYLGHGNADVYTAQNQEVVFQTCTGNEAMIGRVWLLLSCSCGIRLAPDTVNKGGLTVFGWTVDFTWVAVTTPENDVYAKPYFDAVNAISNSLVDGMTTGEAYNVSIQVFNDGIDAWTQSADPYASMVIEHLIHDRDGLTLFGDTNAKILVGGTPPLPPTEIIENWPIEVAVGLVLLLLL